MKFARAGRVAGRALGGENFRITNMSHLWNWYVFVKPVATITILQDTGGHYHEQRWRVMKRTLFHEVEDQRLQSALWKLILDQVFGCYWQGWDERDPETEAKARHTAMHESFQGTRCHSEL